MKIKKIKSKYMIRIIIFLFLVIGAMILIYGFFAKDYFIYITKKEMTQYYQKIEKLDFENLSEKDKTRLDDITAEGYSLQIVRKGKRIYANSSSRHRLVISKEHLDDYVENPTIRYVDSKQLLMQGKIKQNDLVYYVWFNMYIKNVDSSVDTSRRFLFMEMIGALLLGILFSFYLATRTVKPIERLGKMTKRMENNESISYEEYQFPDDEIGKLAKTVQGMYEKISDNLIEEKNYNYLLKMQNRDLAELDLKKKTFIQSTTHELKTPLAIISSQVEIMNMDYPEAMSEYYDSIMEEIEKMSTLIREMLKSSFSDDVEQEIVLEKNNISALLNTQQNKYMDWMGNKNLHCTFDIQPDLYIKMNPEQIEQAFNNFMMNAYEHAKPYSNVEVTLHEKDGFVYLSVYNEGKNIPEQDFEEIWNRYFSEKSRKENANIGLGLYIVHSIVKSHNGECFVKNTRKGVVFIMKFRAE